MTITSKEVAEMLGKRHDNLLRAIRKYITQLGDEAPNSEVRRYMEECLFENEHITGVQDLEVSQIKDVLHIKFTLVTDVGSKEVEMDV